VRGFPIILSAVVGIVAADAKPAHAICVGPEPDPDAVSFVSLQSGVGFAEAFTVSVRGGVWSTFVDDSMTAGARECGPLRWLRIPESGADGEEIEVDVLRAGTQLGLFRVPLDANPDEFFAPFKECDGGNRYFFGTHTVNDAVVVDRPAPLVLGDDTRVRAPDGDAAPCRDTPGLYIATSSFFTLIDLEMETEATELLFDAWLLPRGAELPAEEAPRFIETRRIDVDESALHFQLGEVGAHTLHLRFTDPATGLASDLYSIDVDTPAPEFQGCYCGAGSRADIAWAASFAALLVILRRRRARR
jgi:hypothetical protein